MVLGLLEVDHGAILADRLVCLSKDWVQGLLEDACVVVPVERLDHDNLEALDRVVDGCRVV